ncbi:MAG: DUF721 domain-containing protein [Simkania sp.]|nr:DUF721 domain-containing protein [Simkania sp.]
MRTSRNYDGTRPTGQEIKKLLPELLGRIGAQQRERPDLVLAAWPEIIGPRLASYAEAVSFREGILIIKVKNSTLYSLLSEHEKPRLLKSLQEKFPSVTIKNLIFRIG